MLVKIRNYVVKLTKDGRDEVHEPTRGLVS